MKRFTMISAGVSLLIALTPAGATPVQQGVKQPCTICFPFGAWTD